MEVKVRITRLYTGPDNQSHFEDLDIPLNPASYGVQSDPVPVTGAIFRETPVGGALDFHPAPRRQFVVTLSGMGELECGDGTRRRFGPGAVMLAEDTTGQGHITREIGGSRAGIFLPLPEDFDISKWRVKA